ncbi:glycosyltransferase family 4 protein [uncultured Sulfitobacter sp.]|uniref:glycosyltransferase family 4 protein n=1 Tax=uncultured Sulfitobacter sp. TaxID=191468 RepID=UPI0026154031|nr:glycosyltransferase family 4 protein [uncultured Sulfitobacter sp.]
MTDFSNIQVIAPNFKRRLSGVTATIVRLVPVQARDIGIVATGPVMPPHVPQIPLRALITMPRHPTRVWHARRNVEMIGGLALKYLLGKRLKLVFTSASQRKQTGLTRWLIRRMDAVVATSEKTASYLENPAKVIMHGIDLEGYSPPADRAALRTKLGLPADGLLIGCYGRIRRSKGTDLFYAAMAGVNKCFPAHALIMGRAVQKDQKFLQWIKDGVAETDFAERFHFLPEVPVENMADWYRVLDLYVAPQRSEGFGLTPIEAMACGVPVVATRVGAFEQIVTPDTGMLVDPDDSAKLMDAICEAFEPPHPIEQWAKNARPHVTEHFSIEREAQSLIDLYRKLLD